MPPKNRKRKKKRKGHYHRGTYVSRIAGECKYRSGWELKYMEYLDADPNVAIWTYEKLKIEYISNQKTKKIRTYYPDFQVVYANGKKVVIEIKPLRKLQQLSVVKKIRAAKEWCSTNDVDYKVLTEMELKELGLL